MSQSLNNAKTVKKQGSDAVAPAEEVGRVHRRRVAAQAGAAARQPDPAREVCGEAEGRGVTPDR